MGLWWSYVYMVRKRQVNQDDLNDLYEPFEFETPKAYGELHASLFVTLAVAPGLPITVWFFVFYLLNVQLKSRWLLLRNVAKPEKSDEVLVMSSLRTLPWASILHFAFGVWMFGAAGTQTVFGSDASIELSTGNDIYSLDAQFNPRYRVLKTAAMPQFVAFILCAVLIPAWSYGPSLLSMYFAMTRSRRGNAGIDPLVLALPSLSAIRPADVREPVPISTEAEERMRSVAAMVGRAGRAAEGPQEKLVKLRLKDLFWEGSVAYDVTSDERFEKIFRAASASGKLSAFEVARFTVFSHGGVVARNKKKGASSRASGSQSGGRSGGGASGSGSERSRSEVAVDVASQAARSVDLRPAKPRAARDGSEKQARGEKGAAKLGQRQQEPAKHLSAYEEGEAPADAPSVAPKKAARKIGRTD